MAQNDPVTTNVGSAVWGVGFLTFLVFLVLQFSGAVDWSWWWVFSPLLFALGLSVALVVVLNAVRAVILAKKDKTNGRV